MITVLENLIGSVVLAGTSTDIKPLNVGNGSVFREVDTGIEYWFDEQGKQWTPVANQGVSPTVPTGEVYHLSVSTTQRLETGAALDPTAVTINILDSSNNVVDTIKESILSNLILSNDASGMYYDNGDTGIVISLLDYSEEYVHIDVIEKAGDDYMLMARFYDTNEQWPVYIPSNWLVNGSDDISLLQNKSFILEDVTVYEGVPVYHLEFIKTTSANPVEGESWGLDDFEVRVMDADDVMVNAIAKIGDYEDNAEYAENGLCSQTVLEGETQSDNVVIKMYNFNYGEEEYTSLENLVAGRGRLELTAFMAGGVYPVVLTADKLADATHGDITIYNRRLAHAYLDFEVAESEVTNT